MSRMFRVWSLTCVAVLFTVVSCDTGASNNGITDILNKDTYNFHGHRRTPLVIKENYGSIARTFGPPGLRRLSFIFLPVMFTLGVISTLLMALAVISVKNLGIGVLLLIVGMSQAVSRLFAAPAAAPLVFHPRTEVLPAPAIPAAWPPTGPLLSPWARSDNGATISD